MEHPERIVATMHSGDGTDRIIGPAREVVTHVLPVFLGSKSCARSITCSGARPVVPDAATAQSI
eukprot:8754838-Lingulodinium_polyedra.AAC.1